MSRPIERLPVRRLSNEPKEAMNCKSCRKRKIKCNRFRPSCEACQVFNCACIYDAIPKKRGPKTDVLEALLKRVNGLEKKLKDEKKPGTNGKVESPANGEGSAEDDSRESEVPETHAAIAVENARRTSADQLPAIQRPQAPKPQADALIDAYFSRVHGRPYYIVDEAATRQRQQAGQLPNFLLHSIYAVSVRHAYHIVGGHNAAIRSSQDYALRARTEIDVDEPSIDNLQALLLLAIASFQAGKGRKSFMLLSSGISMALALTLHRELPTQLRISPMEREGRRKLFWTCYLMDRFTASGSRRPSLIADESISLRLPAWQAPGSQVVPESNYFPNGASLPYTTGSYHAGQSSGAMLIDVVRILGITNRYLASGGVKGDSHFPWHAQSNLSKIRQDLDLWAASTQDAFASLEILFGHAESSTLVLSKLIYHLIHCLIYRPFLPVDLAELSGTGQHQSWQIEATNLCFLHANAIAELVEIGKNTIIDWPSFVGYCICTAATIHVHGAHYPCREGDVFARSAEFLSREMAQLSELRLTWGGVQHQRTTLQTVYDSHSQLVKSLASNPMRFSPVFQMEDFFDRYAGSYIDGAHVAFTDVIIEAVHESLPTYKGLNNLDLWMSQVPNDVNRELQSTLPNQYMTSNSMMPPGPKKKRRRTEGSQPCDLPILHTPQSMSGHMDLQQAGGAQSTEMQASADSTAVQCDYLQAQTFTQNPFSPSYNFSPMPAPLSLQPPDTYQYDQIYGMQGFDHQTPGGISASAESAHTDPDKDPFLSLLEQLAENDGSNNGPTDLDFFLSGQG